MPNLTRLAVLPLLGLPLAGCSIAMALSGTPEPNFDAFEVGSTRKQVEVQLGTPVTTQPLGEGKRLDIYHYEIGNSPNGHRALMNFYIDLATIGIWELPGTVIEAMMGRTEESRIIYGAEDRVLEIHGYRPPSPSSELKKAVQAQDKYRRPSSNGETRVP
jgi:hypothetical protein